MRPFVPPSGGAFLAPEEDIYMSTLINWTLAGIGLVLGGYLGLYFLGLILERLQ